MTSYDDWPKATLDLTVFRDGELRMVESADDLRLSLAQSGATVEDFKPLPAYTLALESGNYPWLAEL